MNSYELRKRSLLLMFKQLAYQIILLAVNPPVNIIERFTAERSSAGTAYEAIGMIEIAHCLTSLSGAGYFLTACMANTYHKKF